MIYGRTELSEFDAESEEDKQHLQVNKSSVHVA